MTVRATWKGVVLAESDRTVVGEGNHYFPVEDVREQYFDSSQSHTCCPWKGQASYRSVVVDGRRNQDAAWFHPSPMGAARESTDRMVLRRGVTVEQVP
ncbi:MAG TPA: DUF427 domain-containing protein [Acidimicrobiales bacterium]|nr:DUF427 domain-containing protein [Acidimicrobiales bacterium]